MNAFRLTVMAVVSACLASSAAADAFSWNFQRTGFRSSAGVAQTAVSMRANQTWPVVYGLDLGALNAYSLFPVANPGQVPIGPATNWHSIGTNITKSTLPPGNIFLQAASGAPDGFGVAVQSAISTSQPPSVTIWGTSTSGFHAPQSNTQAIKFDADGNAFVAATSMLPIQAGRPDVLYDVAVAATGEIGAMTQQSNGIGPVSFWQRSPLLGGNWLSSPLTSVTQEQTLFGPSADMVYDASSRPHVIGLNRATTSNSVVAYSFNISTGAWQLNTLETTTNSPPIADVAAASNDDGILGAAWVNNGVLKYAYLDTNELSPSWVTTTVASTTPTGMPLELQQGVGLAYDKSGLPVISFVERSNRQIWVAYDPPLLSAASPSGDFNGNGLVDADDLVSWMTGMTDGAIVGDADADGDTDGADFLAWQRQLGSPRQSSGFASSIPEPAGLGLFVLGMTAVIRRRRPA